MINLKFVTNTLLFAEWWEKPYFVAPLTPSWVVITLNSLPTEDQPPSLSPIRMYNNCWPPFGTKAFLGSGRRTWSCRWPRWWWCPCWSWPRWWPRSWWCPCWSWQCSGYRGVPDRADVPDLLNLVHSLPVDLLLTGILVILFSQLSSYFFLTGIFEFLSHKYPRNSIFHNMIILIDLMIIVFIILIFTDPFQSMMKLCSSEVHLQLNHLDKDPFDWKCTIDRIALL